MNPAIPGVLVESLMPDRLLTYVNLLLIAVIGGCVWYLVSDASEYATDYRIVQILDELEKEQPAAGVETIYNAAPIERKSYPALESKDPFDPFYTPTPTPTPSPTPTPAPPPLPSLTQFWKLIDLRADRAVFSEERLREEFTLRIGESRDCEWTDGQVIPVTLRNIDLATFSVTVEGAGQIHVINL